MSTRKRSTEKFVVTLGCTGQTRGVGGGGGGGWGKGAQQIFYLQI